MLTNHSLLPKFFEWAAVTGKSYRSIDEFGFRLDQFANTERELEKIRI